jgi:hypothetical protein
MTAAPGALRRPEVPSILAEDKVKHKQSQDL